jgi:hypothetical protein
LLGNRAKALTAFGSVTMSLSRDFSTFVAALNYDALPPEVIDRAKGVTLQALSSALVAHDMPASRQALALMQEEEAGSAGIASALCSGVKLTKAGAAFVNAEMILAGGKWDTFRMLTHPGTRDQLPFLGGRSQKEIEALLTRHGLVNVGGDPLLDLVEAQARRMVDEGRERRTHRRYAVWGDVAR